MQELDRGAQVVARGGTCFASKVLDRCARPLFSYSKETLASLWPAPLTRRPVWRKRQYSFSLTGSPEMKLGASRAWTRFISHIWGGICGDGRIDRVVVRDEIGHDCLGPLPSLAEAIEFLFPLKVVEAGEQPVHLLLDRNIRRPILSPCL